MGAVKQRADFELHNATVAQAAIIELEADVRDLHAEVARLTQEHSETGATILRLRAEATEQRELAEKEREFGNVAHANGQRLQRLVDVLTSGIAAYRSGSFTLPQVWENGEGKEVPR